MRDRTNDLEVRCASPWAKLHGLLNGETQTDGRMSTDWFGRKCLRASVRLSSSAPSEYRQRIAIISVILKALKISTKYVDNSVEKLEASEVGSLPRLSFLYLCLKFGQSFNLLISCNFPYSTANFSRGNTYPSNFNHFHSIVIMPVNKSPHGPDLPGQRP